MSKVIRQIILFGAPVVVGVMNLFHPVHFEMTGIYDAVQQQVAWWITLHFVNLLSFPVLGLAVYLLIKDTPGTAALVGKVALAVFVPTYTGFDALAGIGTGTLIQNARGLSPDQLAVVKPTIDAYWASAAVTVLATIGSIAWSVSMTAAAIAFVEPKRRPAMLALGVAAGGVVGWGVATSSFGTWPWWMTVGLVGLIGLVVSRPWLPGTLLILAGVFFGTTHVVPYGPLAMVCLVGAAAWLEFMPHRVEFARKVATAA
jgi:hypothetical protein